VAAKKNKRGKHVEETMEPSREEGSLPPASDEYWRREFQNAPSGQGFFGRMETMGGRPSSSMGAWGAGTAAGIPPTTTSDVW